MSDYYMSRSTTLQIENGNFQTKMKWLDGQQTLLNEELLRTPVVTITDIDSNGVPWFEVELVEDDGIHHHSLNITDNDSWTMA